MSPITFFSLDNGLKVGIEPMDGVRSVGISLLVPAGSALEPDALEGLGALWCELLQRGAGELDSRMQADAFDRLGLTRAVRGRTLFSSIGATALGTRLADAIPLLSAMVREPRFDPDAIEPSRELALQSLASLGDDPHQRCALLARSHHLAPPINRSGMGTEHTLNAITRDDLVQWWRRLARPDGAILAIAGEVDPNAIRPVLEHCLGDWQGTAPTIEINPLGQRGYHHEPDESNQVQIDLLHDAPPDNHPDANLERLVQSVLSGGMSVRLFTEVREKRGLCYSVNSSYAPGRDFGTVGAYVGTMPERAQESLDVLLDELRRIHEKNDVTDDEFQRAIVGMKSSIVFAGESSSARASAIAGDIHRRGQPRTLRQIASEIDALTRDDLRDYLDRRTLGTITIQTLGPNPLTPNL